MFYHLEGTVSELDLNTVILDCHGIGFALTVSAVTLGEVKIGSKAKLYVAESIREDGFDLFGFATKKEKQFFNMLTSVSGIGPKAAISILSSNTTDQLVLAIASGNEKALTAAPGVGKKIAQRVILELKDKLKTDEFMSIDLSSGSSGAGAAVVAASSPALNEAVGALAALGYSNSDIAPALKNIDPTDMSSDQILRAVLKQMF